MKNLITYLNEAKTKKLHQEILDAKNELKDILFKTFDKSNDKIKNLLNKIANEYNSIEDKIDDDKTVSLKEWRGYDGRLGGWVDGYFDRYKAYHGLIKKNDYDWLNDWFNKEKEPTYGALNRKIFCTCCEYLEDSGWDDPQVEWFKTTFQHVDTAIYIIICEYINKDKE